MFIPCFYKKRTQGRYCNIPETPDSGTVTNTSYLRGKYCSITDISIAQYFTDVIKENKKVININWEIIESDYPDDLERISI